MNCATYSVPQAAQLLGVSPYTIYSHVDDGKLPFDVVRVGGRYVILREDLDRLLKTTPSSTEVQS